jgi:hypothetical protein
MRDGQMVDIAAEVRGRDGASRTAFPRPPARKTYARRIAERGGTGFDSDRVGRAWQALQRDVGVAPIYTAKQYDRTVTLMNQLFDVVGGNERHPLADLLRLVEELVMSYESRTLHWPDS